MERAHRAKLLRRFKPQLKRARVIRLDIPDDDAFMQPELVALLEKKAGSFLWRPSPARGNGAGSPASAFDVPAGYHPSPGL
ncbi:MULTISPECIES: hypothetical protein [unclassified Brevundimonas]|uniref:hypothetical protein n=1 Tax=unclassified Brevundimonas TaxID=2622653 RepID=UPI0006FE10B0|nr:MULTISPECIES: hypothetical protein [unclassified Brevundimonas]KQY82053.1 hypothetical protein ASD25_25425 [Brevundimonas sp. Root1423]KRA19739.1 hypothetical protein ASD59_12135 [Brevundimonas sp. Root608]